MENDERFYRILKDEFDIPLDTIRRIVKSQFKQCNLTISSREYKAFTLQYLGEYDVKESRKKRIKKVEE